jgi:hypothetical protein
MATTPKQSPRDTRTSVQNTASKSMAPKTPASMKKGGAMKKGGMKGGKKC